MIQTATPYSTRRRRSGLLMPSSGSSPIYAPAVLADTPALYWRLGDTSGTTAADASGNGRNGTYTGTFTLNQTSLLTTDPNPSISLPTADNGQVTSTYAGWATNSTWEIWINPTDTGAFNRRILFGSGANAPALYISSDKTTIIFDADTSAAGTDGSWASANTYGTVQHIVLTLSGTTATLWVNNSSKGSQTVSSFGATPGNIQLAASSFGYSGLMDEFAVYSSVLSSTRIAAHYNAR